MRMQIKINTDHNIQGREALSARLSGVVENALDRVADRITRVEIHLSIESGGKSGQSDKRCVMEARLEGFDPVVVSEQAGSIDQAVVGASVKMLRAIDNTLGRVRDKNHRGADAADPISAPESELPDELSQS